MNTSANKRIAKNTIFLYLRMLLVMSITLYTSRVVLEALGVVDFGIYNVIGGVIGILGFISNSMSISTQRYLSYYLGTNENSKVNSIFSMSINIHLIIGIFICICFYWGGDWVIHNYLDIPESRIDATYTFFHYIVISTCFQIFQVPFIGMIIAQEKMRLLAYISIIESLLKLLIAFLVIWIDIDKLILYGILLTATSLLIFISYVTVTFVSFNGIKYKAEKDISLFKELIGFASWTSLGELGWALTLQGVSVIMNHFFGVISNTAYGIATQISNAVNKFYSSFQLALNPQIIKQYAQEQIKDSLMLTLKGIKFSFILIMMIALPAFFSMNIILQLWLGNIPQYSIIFCKYILIGIVIDVLSSLFSTLVKAYGKIRNYQIIVALVLALNFPLSYFVYEIGFPAQSSLIVYWFISFLLIYVRLSFICKALKIRVYRIYMCSVLLPVLRFTAVALLIIYPVIYYLDDDIYRMLILAAISLLIYPVCAYFTALTMPERKLIKEKLSTFITHIHHRYK